MKKEEIINKFVAIGRAALVYDIENSHSGNIACKWEDENGNLQMAITATGSQKGALEENDICFPGIKKTTFGHYKASSETDIHSAILSLPGVYGSMHAHTKYATIQSLDDEDKPNKPKPLIPVDPLGHYNLGGRVSVEWYRVPSGSPQMIRKIPQHLKESFVTIVQGHGAFGKGSSVEHAFYNLCLTDNSGYILYLVEQMGVSTDEISKSILQNPAKSFHLKPSPYSIKEDKRNDFADEPQTVKEFLKIGYRVFESRLSPFHTGSMSLRCVDTMLYAPKASMPADLPGPLMEVPLEFIGDESEELRIHKEIYASTDFQSVMHTFTPEAEAMAYFGYNRENSYTDRIIPIDGEGSFLYLVVPVYGPDLDLDTLIGGLYDYNVVVIRGGGVWAVGEQSLSEVLHHPSSVRDMCLYRFGALSRGLDIRKLEPAKAKNW